MGSKEKECVEEYIIDSDVTEDIEDEVLGMLKEKYVQYPAESAMALQRVSLSIQEAIRVKIPNDHVSELRNEVREDIRRMREELMERERENEIMYW
jgi:hypothetical protein